MSEEFVERHFFYAVWMLNEARKKIEAGHDDLVIRNVLIESFCTNARALIYFFKGQGGADAKNFTDDGYQRWAAVELPIKVVGKLSTQIAHLSLERTSVETEKIDRAFQQRIYAAIVVEIENFRRHLRKEYQHFWPSDLILPETMAGIPLMPPTPSILSGISQSHTAPERLQITSLSTGSAQKK